MSGGRDGSVIVWGHFKGGLQRIVDFNLFGHSGGDVVRTCGCVVRFTLYVVYLCACVCVHVGALLDGWMD